MNEGVVRAWTDVQESVISYMKYLSPNDVGITGSHQRGIHVGHKSHSALFEDGPGIKGTNKDRWVDIIWFGYGLTHSHFIYYGTGTRNEYRITNFGPNFPFLRPDYVGSMFILCKKASDIYRAYVFNDSSDIREFLTHFGYTPIDANGLIIGGGLPSSFVEKEKDYIEKFIADCGGSFPEQGVIFNASEWIVRHVQKGNLMPDWLLVEYMRLDGSILNALQIEAIEKLRAAGRSSEEAINLFDKELSDFRKSRSEASLRYHIESIFRDSGISFEAGSNGNILISGKTEIGFADTLRSENDLPDFQTGNDWKKTVLTVQPGIAISEIRKTIERGISIVCPKFLIVSYPKTCQKEISSVENLMQSLK